MGKHSNKAGKLAPSRSNELPFRMVQYPPTRRSAWLIVMTIEDYELVLIELQQVIDDAKALMARFEAESADQRMPAEYHMLHELYQRAVKSQHAYTQEMLDLLESDPSEFGGFVT